MRFLLDENVPAAVATVLREAGHDVERVQDLLPAGAADPIVARVSEDRDAVLVSFDRDFRKIAPRIPHGQRARFRRLSIISFRCSEPEGATRMSEALALIETEHAIARSRRDSRMIVQIGSSFIRTER